MTSNEERALLETRRRIEANLDRLARISSSAMEVRSYFEELLQLVGPSITARGGAVWLRDAGKMVIVASFDYESAGVTPGSRQEKSVRQLVSQALQENRPLIIMPGNAPLVEAGASPEAPPPVEAAPTNSAPYPFFYIPVLLDGRPAAVLQFWLQHPGDPGHYRDYAAFLGTVAGHASVFLHHQQSARTRRLASSWQMQTRFHHDLLACHGTQEVLEVSANHMADLGDAELGFACRRNGPSWKLAAASNADKVIPSSAQALLLAAAVDALPKEKLLLFDSSQENIPEPVRRALEQSGAHLLIGSFAAEREGGKPRIFLGAMRQSRIPPPQETADAVAMAATAAARLFHERELREALPLGGLFHTVARWRLLWREQPRRLLIIGATVAAALLLILFLPWPWRISADCTVMPSHRLSAVAGTDGKLVQVLAGEGDAVDAGQVLARLDDRDLRAQLAASGEARQRWEVEAARAQAAGDEASRKIAELNGLKEEENIKLMNYRLARTEITSPMRGIVLTRELRNQEGENMETGKVLCEVADPSSYLLELQIRQQDLGEVQEALADGKPRRIDFILHAHSGQKLHAEIQGLAGLAPAAELGAKGSYFVLRTQFPGDELSLADLKTGYTGKAKITLGARPLWRVLFTPFINYITVEWGV